MVKLDYDAIIKAGNNHGACGIIEHVEHYVNEGRTDYARALIAEEIGWITRKITPEECKLFPKEFVDALQLDLPYRRLAAAKALGLNYSMSVMLRVSGMFVVRAVNLMEIEIDENYFLVKLNKKSKQWFEMKISVWSDSNKAWTEGISPTERILLRTITDPDKARKTFIKLIRKHKAEICAQLR